jgi:hypothetical protein
MQHVSAVLCRRAQPNDIVQSMRWTAPSRGQRGSWLSTSRPVPARLLCVCVCVCVCSVRTRNQRGCCAHVCTAGRVRAVSAGLCRRGAPRTGTAASAGRATGSCPLAPFHPTMPCHAMPTRRPCRSSNSPARMRRCGASSWSWSATCSWRRRGKPPPVVSPLPSLTHTHGRAKEAEDAVSSAATETERLTAQLAESLARTDGATARAEALAVGEADAAGLRTKVAELTEQACRVPPLVSVPPCPTLLLRSSRTQRRRRASGPWTRLPAGPWTSSTSWSW